MSYDWAPAAEDFEAIKNWYDRWSGYVAAVDFVPARDLFDPDVAGFGTHMDIVQGRDNLEQLQWRQVWPTIDGFRFRTEVLKVGVSPDRCMALGLCPWESTGFHADGGAFDRPGRASVAFARDDISAPWLGIHSHFSLNPGTPPVSHGKPADG